MSLESPDPRDDDPLGRAAAEREEMEEDATRLYQEGWAIRQVAARFDTSHAAMRRILVRRTTLRRSRGLD